MRDIQGEFRHALSPAVLVMDDGDRKAPVKHDHEDHSSEPMIVQSSYSQDLGLQCVDRGMTLGMIDTGGSSETDQAE